MTATVKKLGSTKLTETVVTGDLNDYSTTDVVKSTYLMKSDAAKTYLTISDAQTTYATLEDIAPLKGAMHFEGVATAEPSGTTIPAGCPAAGQAAESGDTVIYGNKEYVFDGSAWAEYGDVSDEDRRLADLESRLSVTAQTTPEKLTTANTTEEMMEKVNAVIDLLKASGVFK